MVSRDDFDSYEEWREWVDENGPNGDEPYETSPFSVEFGENGMVRMTSPRRDVEVAEEFMSGPGGEMAREVARQTVAIGDNESGAASFLTDLKRRVRAYNDVHGKDERIRVNDHVCTVIRRMVCADVPEFVEYAALSKARCDRELYERDPERYAFLQRLYGGAL